MADVLRGAGQAQGIVEVARAVGGLDGDAQYNAALVEEPAAAAMASDEQARRLSGTLARVVA